MILQDFKNEEQPIYQETTVQNKQDGDALESVLEYIGGMGRYQIFLVLAMGPFAIFSVFVYFSQMFITLTPQDHWCSIPELQSLDLELRRNLTLPVSLQEDERCWTYKANWSHVLSTLMPPDPNTTLERCQYGWEFQLKDIPYPTVVTDRGWVCEYAGNVPTAQAISFMGSLIGTLFFGWLADRVGRVPALVGSNLIACVGGVATIFTVGLWDFAFCRFMVGLALDSCFMIMYILVLEYVGVRHRTWVATGSLAIYYGVPSALLPLLAISLSNWQKFTLFTSLPMLITIGVPFVIPESTRWLASKGKGDKAVKILKKIANVNGNKVPDPVMNNFLESLREPKTTDESIIALFNSRDLFRIMIAAIIAYMLSAMVFDGLVRLSEHLGLDFFLIFALSSATEIPALLVLAFVLDRWGRRVLTCGPIMIAGILNIIAAFLSQGVLQVILTLISRFFVNMSLTTLVQWVTEILPTPVRASGSSILHVSGFFGGMFSPFVVYAGQYWTPLPLLLFGIASFIICAMGLQLPETMGLSLPQSIADGERLIRENSLFRRNPQSGIVADSKELDNEKMVLKVEENGGI